VKHEEMTTISLLKKGISLVVKILVVASIIILISSSFIVYNYYVYYYGDWDGDGIKNADEDKYGTNPYSKDTDGDGVKDYDEIFVYNLDPNKPNPNVSYALSLGLKDYYKLFIPLDNNTIAKVLIAFINDRKLLMERKL
jgi:pullulanase/glycogen debranching enzyme